MPRTLRLASGSDIRRQMLERAGLVFEVIAPRVDEETMKQSMIAEGARPRDIADALAEIKARRVAERSGPGLTIGSDQVLSIDGQLLSKAATPAEALDQLRRMRGKTHSLHSAAVIFEDTRPVWRFVGEARLKMRWLSDEWLSNYLDRNWEKVRFSVGTYMIEDEGIRLFEQVAGDYHVILGMPLIEVLNYLALRGELGT
jgi:septum formation protein